jgi:hypothetical protein
MTFRELRQQAGEEGIVLFGTLEFDAIFQRITVTARAIALGA